MSYQLTVFIPAFNEEANLEHCVEVVRTTLRALGVRSEILIVDDASTDRTATLADALAAADPDVQVAHHGRNGGIGQAFLTAVRLARGEWLILIPADLAMDPSELHRYLEAAAGADIVVGLRSDRSDYTWPRTLVSFVNIRLVQVLFRTRIRQFQYISMYRMSVLRELDIEYANSAFFLAEIIVKAQGLGKRLDEVEIKYAPRVSGNATGAKMKLIVLTVRDILRFWTKWAYLGPQAASRRRPEGKVA